MLLLIYAAPLVLSAVALFVELRHFFHKTALVISLMVAMVAEMLAMKYLSDSWYMFLCAALVPLAVSYTVLSLWLMGRSGGKDAPED